MKKSLVVNVIIVHSCKNDQRCKLVAKIIRASCNSLHIFANASLNFGKFLLVCEDGWQGANLSFPLDSIIRQTH